jgi:hypothetical protein
MPVGWGDAAPEPLALETEAEAAAARPAAPARSSRPPAPRPVSEAPAAAPRAPSEPPAFLSAEPEPGPRDAVRPFLAPAGLVAAGVAVTLVDGALAASSGEVFSIGPVRLAWLAAALALGGIGLAVFRLLGRER